MFRVWLACTGLVAVLGWQGSIPAAAADKDEAYAVTVENAAAKVGEETAIVARIDTREGYRFSRTYRNRLTMLSALDEAVTFDDEVVIGRLEDGHLVFMIGVVPTKAGPHPINGVFRIGFHKGGSLNMISVPLMATVTGTE